MEAQGGGEVLLYSLFNLGTRWGGWSTQCPSRFTHRKDPVPTVQEAGWVQGKSGQVWKISSPAGIQSPDCPAHSELLYQLSYQGLFGIYIYVNTDAQIWSGRSPGPLNSMW
jgi:hypothetical protein